MFLHSSTCRGDNKIFFRYHTRGICSVQIITPYSNFQTFQRHQKIFDPDRIGLIHTNWDYKENCKGKVSFKYLKKPADKSRCMIWSYIWYNPLLLISRCNLFQKFMNVLMVCLPDHHSEGKPSHKHVNSSHFFFDSF